MKKAFNFLRDHWLLILIVLTILLLMVNKIIKLKIPDVSVSPTPISTKIADFKSIVPGKTNLDEINNLLGFPVEQGEEEGKIIAEYKSSNEFRNNIIIIQNGMATLIKEVVNTPDNKKAQDVVSRFGSAPYRLYEQKPNETFDLYVYPTNGIAYLGHEDGTLLEIWYFEPITIENFISNWAPGYSQREYKGRSQY